jgi:hypothetical protein
MLNAGIEINMDTIRKVEEVRDNKKDFAVFKIKDRKTLVHMKSFPHNEEDINAFNVDKDRENNWKKRVYPAFFETLKSETEPLYLVLDFRYVVDSRRCTKLYFIGWCPEKSSVKDKMVFSATFKQFADKVNIPVRITAHVPADVTYEELLDRSERY